MQALCALLFLYWHVLDEPFRWLHELTRARRPERLSTVLTPQEVRLVLDHFAGTRKLAAILLYGAGLRLLECLQLRVKDVDFDRHEIFVRDMKGKRDRVTVFLRPPLRRCANISCAFGGPSEGSRGGPWSRPLTDRNPPQAAECGDRLGLAVDFSGADALARPGIGHGAPPSHG